MGASRPIPAFPPSSRPPSWLRALAVGAAVVVAPAPLLGEQQPDEPDGVAVHTAHGPRRIPILERATLLDDWGGARSALDEAGVQLEIGYDAEVLGNASGGLRQGAVYQGLWEFDLDIDAGKALGWNGLAAHATAYKIHGRGLTASRLGNLLTVSDIEATPATRLSTLFVEQALAGGLVTLRAGQLAADDEFLISEYAIPLANATFGWPAIVGVDLPSGGPSYPLGTPGIRGRLGGADGLSVMGAVFNGDPVGRGAGDPQRRDPSGTAFRVGDNALAIIEIAYGVSEQRRLSGLSGTYKLGGWYHGGRFDDQRFDTAGLSLADPASSGQPAPRRGNFGLYAVVDQMVWRDPTRHGAWVGAFLRVAGSPEDRNLIGSYLDGGVTANGLVPGRDYDVVSVGAAVARISRDARRLDRDTRAFAATDAPLRDAEALIELTYQAHIAPWLIIEPDLQYVIHPGGHAAEPAGPRAIPDALVAGLRTVVRF